LDISNRNFSIRKWENSYSYRKFSIGHIQRRPMDTSILIPLNASLKYLRKLLADLLFSFLSTIWTSERYFHVKRINDECKWIYTTTNKSHKYIKMRENVPTVRYIKVVARASFTSSQMPLYSHLVFYYS